VASPRRHGCPVCHAFVRTRPYACPVELTKKQRNLLFEAIAATDLDPAECDLRITSRGPVSILHDLSKSRITIGRPTDGWFKITKSVGNDPMQTFVISGWGAVSEAVRSWAEDVKYYAEASDLWAELLQSASFYQRPDMRPLRILRLPQPSKQKYLRRSGRLRSTLRNRFHCQASRCHK
jgi:hypothetical protein